MKFLMKTGVFCDVKNWYKWICTRTLHMLFLFRFDVQLSPAHLHVMIVNICEFRENSLRECRPSLMCACVCACVWVKLRLRKHVKTLWHLKVKAAFVKSVLRHGVQHWQCCYILTF
jgi:hypothetical protein